MAASRSACERALYRFRAQLQGEDARGRLQSKTNRGRIMILPITLTTAGIAALINFWLAMQVGRIRTRDKISMGDGGSEPLVAAMRAHSNFIEYTPIVLILIGLIELAAGTATWLWLVAIVYLAGRVAHGLGMVGALPRGRMIGTLITLLTTAALGLYAVVLPHLAPARLMPVEVIDAG